MHLHLQLDLTTWVSSDSDLDWPDVLPYVRNVHSSYAGRVYSLPLEVTMNLLYYRKDLFEAANLSVPLTWEEVGAIAGGWNGSALAAALGTPYGMCLEIRKGGC